MRGLEGRQQINFQTGQKLKEHYLRVKGNIRVFCRVRPTKISGGQDLESDRETVSPPTVRVEGAHRLTIQFVEKCAADKSKALRS